MDRISDTFSQNTNSRDTRNGFDKHYGWKTLTGLFFIQFLLSPLFMSYGMYSLFLELEGLKIYEILWTPTVFLTTYKVCKSWCRDIAESCSENYFRCFSFFGILACFFGVVLNYYSTSLIYRNIFFGGLAGFGASLTLCQVESRLFDIFQYQSTLIYSIKHLSSALGLFVTPHLINYAYFRFSHTKFIFLYHGALLLHALPASYLFRKPNRKEEKRTEMNYIWGIAENRDGELVDMSESGRNWKSPGDKTEQHYEIHENIEHEIPAPHQKCTLGVDIMPEIQEETEDDEIDETNKKIEMVNDDIKRMSVISCKLEEIIERNEQKPPEVILNITKTDENSKVNINTSIFQERHAGRNGLCCCSPYTKFRYKRRFKSCCDLLFSVVLKPLITSLKVLNFYPCLLSVVHSLFSPLVYLNFMPILANEDLQYGSVSEISFMLSMVAFTYICFLITLPWIAEISKRKVRYLYILGTFISAMALYIIVRNKAHDFMTVSCLVYGAGLGIEAYSLEIVIKEYLGVKNWTKVEGTLDCMSGILLSVILVVINSLISNEQKNSYITTYIRIAMYSHLAIFCVWIVFPSVEILKYQWKEHHKKRYSFMKAT